MYRIDNGTAISPIPAPAAVGPNPNYFFTGGNPALGIPATIVDADWLNALQEEVSAVIEGSGIVLSKTVRNQLLTSLQKLTRVKLSAATSFYVRADGNDANTGTANTAGGAWLTIQHAINALLLGYDFGGNQVTINVGAGAFAGFNLFGQASGQAGIPLVISGNGAGATTINTVITIAYSGYGLVQNSTIGNGAASAIVATELGRMTIGAGVILSGAGAGGALLQAQLCGLIQIGANLTVSGGAPFAFQATDCSAIFANVVTITLTGTPAFSGAFAAAKICGTVDISNVVFAGSATGPRYFANLNGAINVNGGGANFFPGNSAGSVSNGGQYA